ncbi:c-type cytochrome domain-containing protein [Magnetococcales bacterium HHB-1]
MRRPMRLKAILSASFALTLLTAGMAQAERVGTVRFGEDILPLLKYRCGECHSAGGAGEAATGLNLETYEGVMRGTRHGPIVVPGSPLASNLNVLVEGRAKTRMPHNKRRLSDCEIDILRKWVAQGAKNN